MHKKNFIRKGPENKIIFIVEDNEVYAKTLQTFILNRFPEITEVVHFRIGEMCLLEMHRNPFIVIMDYYLDSQYAKAENGLEIIKRIREKKSEINIIVLSVQEKINIAVEAIKQYDCLYVQKDEGAFTKVEQFIQALCIVNARKSLKI